MPSSDVFRYNANCVYTERTAPGSKTAPSRFTIKEKEATRAYTEDTANITRHRTFLLRQLAYKAAIRYRRSSRTPEASAWVDHIKCWLGAAMKTKWRGARYTYSPPPTIQVASPSLEPLLQHELPSLATLYRPLASNQFRVLTLHRWATSRLSSPQAPVCSTLQSYNLDSGGPRTGYVAISYTWQEQVRYKPAFVVINSEAVLVPSNLAYMIRVLHDVCQVFALS